VNINSLALATPINRGNRYVPPAPGMIAKLVSGKPIIELTVAILISHAKANSNPPPRAGPSMSAIVGIDRLYHL